MAVAGTGPRGVFTLGLSGGSAVRKQLDVLGVMVVDAGGLAVFAIAESLKALELGTVSLTAVIVGVMTAVGAA